MLEWQSPRPLQNRPQLNSLELVAVCVGVRPLGLGLGLGNQLGPSLLDDLVWDELTNPYFNLLCSLNIKRATNDSVFNCKSAVISFREVKCAHS